jgi:uncharacterized protein YbbC (DUF1343 family)
LAGEGLRRRRDLKFCGGAALRTGADENYGNCGGEVAHRIRWYWCWLWVAAACATAGRDGAVVRPGIDVIISDSLHLIGGDRVGLLTNQTGVGRNGSSDVELLLGAGVNLTTLFSPEHGFRGVLDQETIGHGVDSATGLPIYSLYGDTRAPTSDMLALIDVLVIDLQDIGARTYTYISTALLAMRAARAANRRVLILDRPNPIGGQLVQGPVMSPRDTSYVGMLQIPLRHGMTFGELALYGNWELGIGADLVVIPADGWRRDRWFDAVGLPWIRPSPNMPSLESATHYPGVVMFEATNLSVGRGTPVAFQVVGAPWLDAAGVLDRLGDLPGVSLADTLVTPEQPTDGKYGGSTIPAIRLRVEDRRHYDPVRTATEILATVYAVHGDDLVIRNGRLDRLAGTDAVRHGVTGGGGLEDLWSTWPREGTAFRARRAQFLLYR